MHVVAHREFHRSTCFTLFQKIQSTGPRPCVFAGQTSGVTNPWCFVDGVSPQRRKDHQDSVPKTKQTGGELHPRDHVNQADGVLSFSYGWSDSGSDSLPGKSKLGRSGKSTDVWFWNKYIYETNKGVHLFVSSNFLKNMANINVLLFLVLFASRRSKKCPPVQVHEVQDPMAVIDIWPTNLAHILYEYQVSRCFKWMMVRLQAFPSLYKSDVLVT